MKSLIFTRLISGLISILGVLVITFMLIHLVPGDPVELMLGDHASAVDKKALRESLNLHLPIQEQFTTYIGNLFSGNLGTSLFTKRSVTLEITDRLPATLELGLAALIISFFIGIPLGVLSSPKNRKIFRSSNSFFSLIGLAMPSFWLGPVLIFIFAVKLNILPVSEHGTLAHLILPSLTLASGLIALVYRMTLSSMQDVLVEDYIRVALAKGNSKTRTLFKHALKNALMPLLTLFGILLGSLLTGTVIVETIFDWPGLGSLIFESLQRRDYPMIQGTVLFVATVYVLSSLVTDILYALLQPKVQMS